MAPLRRVRGNNKQTGGMFLRFSASAFNVILRRYSLPEVPRRRIHNVIANAMSICVAFSNKVMDTRDWHSQQGVPPKYDVVSWFFKRLLNSYCKSIKYPSPEAYASTSPSGGEVGRSMIEMLGVLAIIAVLTTGGIAGYSKAMTKFKVNKAVEEYTMLMTGLMEYENNLFKTHTGFISQFILDAKLVPGNWKLENQIYLTDDLGNRTSPYIDRALTGIKFSADIHITNKNSEFAYQLCMALAHEVAYPLSSNADYVSLFIPNDVMPNNGIYTVYTTSCHDSKFEKVKCISDMTLSDISQICKSCTQRNSCDF